MADKEKKHGSLALAFMLRPKGKGGEGKSEKGDGDEESEAESMGEAPHIQAARQLMDAVHNNDHHGVHSALLLHHMAMKEKDEKEPSGPPG